MHGTLSRRTNPASSGIHDTHVAVSRHIDLHSGAGISGSILAGNNDEVEILRVGNGSGQRICHRAKHVTAAGTDKKGEQQPSQCSPAPDGSWQSAGKVQGFSLHEEFSILAVSRRMR